LCTHGIAKDLIYGVSDCKIFHSPLFTLVPRISK